MRRALSVIALAFIVLGSCATRRIVQYAPPETPRTAAPPLDLLTVAEKSDFKATARHADVVALLDRLALASPLVRRIDLGHSTEGRSIPAIIIADPPVANADEARRSGKLVVFAFGNIHAGEVDGKEALPILARDIITAPEHAILDHLIIVLAPIYNADGNERVAMDHRPGQLGPEEGMGIRENAAGLDLNRDFTKLDAPETRALIEFLRKWDPAVVIDTHTTDGSLHRYLITYAGPKAPAGDARLIEYVRDTMLPAVTANLEKNHGWSSYFYGNFNADHTRWETFPAEARYSTTYVGMRNRIGILSEGYSYASYRDRVLATRDFVRTCFEYADANREEIRKIIAAADTAAAKPVDESTSDEVAIASAPAPFPDKVTLAGYDEILGPDGRPISTSTPHDYLVEHWNNFQPAKTVTRPFAYLIPPDRAAVIENLQRHAIAVEELREDVELDIEIYRIDSAAFADRKFQDHAMATVAVTARSESRRFPAGTIVVRTAQPLGRLAVYLLEPAGEDSLATWNYFDSDLTAGADFPILRIAKPTTILTANLPPLPEDRRTAGIITYDVLEGRAGPVPNYYGSPIGGLRWLPDGDHYLQNRDGNRSVKVDALTGRSEPFTTANTALMREALARLPGISEDTARNMANRALFSANSDFTGALLENDNDLYFASFDGATVVRLTSTPKQREELTSLSPDSKFASFVRDNNLFVVDVATQSERALSTGGSDTLRFGKADWVYYEELFGRSWRTYWWSPDSQFIAFMRTDSSMVPSFTLVNDASHDQRVESARYPKPGEPNPQVSLGIVNITTATTISAAADTTSISEPLYVDLTGYPPADTLVTGVGWRPDSAAVYFYLQDRAQTWLDLCTAPSNCKDNSSPAENTEIAAEIPAATSAPDNSSAAIASNDSSATSAPDDSPATSASETSSVTSVPETSPDPATLLPLTKLRRETTDAWVDSPGSLNFLSDGSFILPRENTGWRHFTLVNPDGSDRAILTAGEWEARAIERLDESAGWLYFTATRDSHLGPNLYKVRLDGTGLTRLTPDRGAHNTEVSPNGKYFIDSWSSAVSPTRVALRSTADGSILRTLDTNPVRPAVAYRLGEYSQFQIILPDGFPMEVSLTKPAHFDPAKKYPMWIDTYAGPHSPTISDSWGAGRLWDQALANTGVLVVGMDPRPASAKGAVSAWSAYRKLGVQELKDIEDAVRWFIVQPWVDADRIGITGHSYGGFMTVFALTHSNLFAAGLAGAPPTDWREYDTIYTERYMDTPEANPDGYDETSAIKAAKNLHGKLLLVHGGMDDNVHLQNTTRFIRALQEANQPFEMMVYPVNRHGVGGRHFQLLARDFIQRTIGGGPIPASPPTPPTPDTPSDNNNRSGVSSTVKGPAAQPAK